MLRVRIANRILLSCCCSCVLFCLPPSVDSADPPQRYWPSWRGPQDIGSTHQGTFPTTMGAGKNLHWQVKLPGIGCSTPVVWDQHILVTAPLDGQDALLSYDWEGNLRWQTPIGGERPGKHRNGSGSNPSPVTDGQHIFVYFKSGNVAGLDFAGNLLWKTNLQQRFAKDTLYWDLGTSPVLTDQNVVVAVMHSGESFLVAFDKASGELKWKVPRNYETPVEGDHSYATPLIVNHKGQQRIIVWGAEHLTAHDAASGKVIWSCAGFNPDQERNWVVVASPVIAEDMVLVPYGRGSHLTGVKLGGEGEVTETHRLWTREDTGVFVPSPVVFNNKVYLVRDSGEVQCLDPKSGETIWEDRFPKNRNKFYASPLIADGILYAPREDGVILVARISEGFEFLSENDLGQRIIASPVPVADRLLIRGELDLFCIGATSE